MIPRYVIIDEYEREKFEKKWQIPYGYGDALYVTADAEDAMRVFEEDYIKDADEEVTNSLVIEEITDNGRSLFYRK